jgi:hypothetical protein
MGVKSDMSLALVNEMFLGYKNTMSISAQTTLNLDATFDIGSALGIEISPTKVTDAEMALEAQLSKVESNIAILGDQMARNISVINSIESGLTEIRNKPMMVFDIGILVIS